jgi:hypothetical protein
VATASLTACSSVVASQTPVPDPQMAVAQELWFPQAIRAPVCPIASSAGQGFGSIPNSGAISANGDTCVETIQAAAARVASLASGLRPGRAPDADVPDWDLTNILDLLRRERFVDALAASIAIP